MTGPLIEQAKVLGDRIIGLKTAVDQLDSRTNRNERVQLWVIFGLLLDLVLSVVVTLVVAGQFTAAADIKAIVDREAATRNQGVCPVYALVIGGYDPSSRAEGPARDAYIQSFKTISEAYKALECKQAPVPPRTEQTPVPVPR